MARMEVLLPGRDPIHDDPPPMGGMTLRGCLTRFGIIATLIMGGLWLFFNSRPIGHKVVIELTDTPSPVLSSTPGDYTRTPTLFVLPTDTRVPTVTQAPTTTGTPTDTPEWWQCTGQLRPLHCDTISDWPMYNATYAMSVYQTQVAPLTPTNTPTIRPTSTRTPTPKTAARKNNTGTGASALHPQSQPIIPTQPSRPTLYATYWLPPVAATVAPTNPPALPNYCVPGSTWANWGVEGATPYVITLTPRPECLTTIVPAPTAQPTADVQMTPQEMR